MDSILQKNITEQLDRLISQLSDLDELKEELSEEEYADLKKETLDQIQEFEAFLEKNKEKYAEAAAAAKSKLEAEK